MVEFGPNSKNSSNSVFDSSAAMKTLANGFFLGIGDTKFMSHVNQEYFSQIEKIPSAAKLIDYFNTIFNNNSRNNSVCVYFTVSSPLRYQQYKQNNGFFQYLQSANAWLRPKGVGVVTDIRSISFIVFRHPRLTF